MVRQKVKSVEMGGDRLPSPNTDLGLITLHVFWRLNNARWSALLFFLLEPTKQNCCCLVSRDEQNRDRELSGTKLLNVLSRARLTWCTSTCTNKQHNDSKVDRKLGPIWGPRGQGAGHKLQSALPAGDTLFAVISLLLAIKSITNKTKLFPSLT